MSPKLIFLLTLLSVLLTCTIASAQGEEITLSTYYPAPFGEYDELCAEKLLVDTPSAAELQDMARGDCHITRSLIIGQGGAPGGFSYDEIGGSLADGTVLIKGDVGIGTPEPDGVLHIERDGAAGTTLLHLTGNSEEYAGLRFRIGGGNAAGAQDYFEITGRPSYAAGVGSGGDIRILRWHNPYPTNAGNLWLMPDGGNVGIGTTNPTHKLSVVGTNLDTVAIGQIGGNARQLLIGYDTANNRGEIQALEQNVGWRNLILNGYGGNVGIGTTTPQAKLHVGGTAGTDGVMFPDGTTQTSAPGSKRCRVYHSVAQSIPNGTFTALNFNSESWDTDNIHNNTNMTRLTCNTSGLYLISGTVHWWHSGSRRRLCRIRLNGSVFLAGTEIPAYFQGYPTHNVTTIYYLNAGDYLELTLWQDSGGSFSTVQEGTWTPSFMMARIGN